MKKNQKCSRETIMLVWSCDAYGCEQLSKKH